jgi:PAS domain S-box-containing protein
MFAFDDQFYALWGTTAEREGGPLMSSQDYARKFIPAEDASIVAEEISKALATTNPKFTSQVEHRIIRADGTEGVIAVRFGITKDSKGHTIRTYGANQDITDRKRAEDALRESEQRLANIIDFLPDATFAVDREGKVIAWNRAIEDMTGISKDDMLDRGGYAYAVPFYGKPRPTLIDLVIQDQKDIESIYTNILRKGDQIIAEASTPMLNRGKGAYLWGIASPLYDRRGSIVGAIQSIRDITDRKQMEVALRESKDYLDEIINSIGDPMFVKDRQHRFILVNDAFCAVTDHTREEFIGKTDYDFFPREQVDVFWEKEELVFQTGKENVNEELITDP